MKNTVSHNIFNTYFALISNVIKIFRTYEKQIVAKTIETKRVLFK